MHSSPADKAPKRTQNHEKSSFSSVKWIALGLGGVAILVVIVGGIYLLVAHGTGNDGAQVAAMKNPRRRTTGKRRIRQTIQTG